jgi:hypothetical protein
MGSLHFGLRQRSGHVANMEARRHDPTASVSTDDTANEKSEIGNEDYAEVEASWVSMNGFSAFWAETEKRVDWRVSCWARRVTSTSA